MFELVIRIGNEVVERRSFDQQAVTVGRGKQMDLRLAEPAASKHHATIRREGNAHVLHDLVSRNGTWVNEVRVNVRALNDGDRIRIGSYVLEYASRIAPAWMSAPAPDGGDAALDAVLGATFALGPEREREQKERSDNRRALLVVEGAGACPVASDVFLIGSGEGCHLRLAGRRVPRVAAVVVRGPGGFSLVNLSPDGTVEGNPIGDRLRLEDGDHVSLGPSCRFTFRA